MISEMSASDTIKTTHSKSHQFFSEDFPFSIIKAKIKKDVLLWHDHDFFELVFILDGKGVHKTLGNKLAVKKGLAFLIFIMRLTAVFIGLS